MEIFLVFLNNFSRVGKKEDLTLKNEIFNQTSLVKCYYQTITKLYYIKSAFIYCRIIQLQKNSIGFKFFPTSCSFKTNAWIVICVGRVDVAQAISFQRGKKKSTITFTAVKLDTKEQRPLLKEQIKAALNELCKVVPSVRLSQKHRHIITSFSDAEIMWCLFLSRLDPKVKVWPRIRERRGASANTNAPNVKGSGWVATPGPTWDRSASSVTSTFTLISR